MIEKEIRVLKLEPNKHPEEVVLINELKYLQEAVGGYIEILGLDNDICILLNEEGKLLGLKPNRRIKNDILVGTFYICGSNLDGELTSLTEEEFKKYNNMFYEPDNFSYQKNNKKIDNLLIFKKM